MFGRKEKKLPISPMNNVIDGFQRSMPPMSMAIRGDGGNILMGYLNDNENLVQWAARNGLGTNSIELRLGAQYFTTLAKTVLEQMRLGNTMIEVLSGANRRIYEICVQKDPVRMADMALGLCELIASKYHRLSRSNEKSGFLGIRKKDTDWDKLVGFGVVQPWMGLIETIAESAPSIRHDIKVMTREEISQAVNYIRLKNVVRGLKSDMEKREKRGNQIASKVNTGTIPMERRTDRIDFQKMRERLTREMQEVITAVAKREDVRDHVQSLEDIVSEMEGIPEASVKEMRECVQLGLEATRVYTIGLGIETADSVYEAAALQRFTTIVNAINLSMMGVLGLSQAITSVAIMNTQITAAMLGQMNVEVNKSKFNPRDVVSEVLNRWQKQKQIVMTQARIVDGGRPDEVNLGGLIGQVNENEALLNSSK